MSEGAEMGVLPGMGDLPERTAPAPRKAPADGGAAGRGKRATKKGKRQPAEVLPVARVAVDMSLPHLDRPFDYLVPTTLDVAAVPGCRVRVRFAGQLVDGFLLERTEQSDHEGRLAYLERVTSSEPVLAPEIAALAREIADRYAGTLADVLRLAIPPRHARVEAENLAAPSATKAVDEGEQAGEEAGGEGGEDAGGEAAVTEAAEAGSTLDGLRSTGRTAPPSVREPVAGAGTTADENVSVADESLEQARADENRGEPPADENADRERHNGSRSDGVKETPVAGRKAAPRGDGPPESEGTGRSGALADRQNTKAGTAPLGPAETEKPEPPTQRQSARDAAPGNLAHAPEEPAHIRVTGGHDMPPGEDPATPSAPQRTAEGHPAPSTDDAEVPDGRSQPAGGHGPVPAAGRVESGAARKVSEGDRVVPGGDEEVSGGGGVGSGGAAEVSRGGGAESGATWKVSEGDRVVPGGDEEVSGGGGAVSGGAAEASEGGGAGSGVASGGVGESSEGGRAASGGDAGVSDGRAGVPEERGVVSGAGPATAEGSAGGSQVHEVVSERPGAVSAGPAGAVGAENEPGVVSGGPGTEADGHGVVPEGLDVVADAHGPVSGERTGAAAGEPAMSGGPVATPGGPVAPVREGAVEVGPWEAYTAGAAFLGALREGRAPRAVWSALPGGDWTAEVARAASVTLDGGRGVLIVVADGRDVARVDAALVDELGAGRHVALTAELGPAERYRRWLAVRRGRVAAVVGTRAAIFAPVENLGLVVLWDDGDDVHAEPHAPYPHAREVLALRAHRAQAGALIGGFTRTTDATQLVVAGWAHPLVPERARLRGSMAYIRPSGDDAELARDEAARSARLPHMAFRAARQGLEHGPVLVQVPRRGYVPALACSRCRGPARCSECEGPLSLRSSHAAPYCRWCGRIAGGWTCPECGGRQVRAVVVGARRTAEELGRAFPGVPIRTSGRDGVLAEVTGEPALVVATPGAEPVADGGYAAALLLDGWVLLGRADLRAGEEALRRWMNAAALVRPRGPVIVLADGSLTPVQALIRWDPVTYAERELAERRELGFPPAVRMASLTGSPQSIRELVEAAGLPEDAEVLGPVELDEGQERALVRVDRARGVALARLLKAAQAMRSTRKTTDVVRVRVDPLELI